jgi:hypothetical protein
MSDNISINYFGSPNILNHPLYLKWSQLDLTSIQLVLASIQFDLGAIEANMHNLEIIAYLSTVVRACGLIT